MPEPTLSNADRVAFVNRAGAAPVELVPSTDDRPGAGYTPTSDCDTRRIALGAEIAALRACVAQRKPIVEDEVDAYLIGARALLAQPCGVPQHGAEERVQHARVLFQKASALYDGYVRKDNRRLFVMGVLCSALAVATALPITLYVGAQVLAWVGRRTALADLGVFGAADLPALLVLFGFAGLGSCVSVLSRLDKIAVPQVFTRRLVMLSGVGRPLVAAVFATVIYALVQAGHVQFCRSETDSLIHPQSIVHWWCVIIAFLCGYSERFASDLLAQASLGRSEPAAVPNASGLAARKRLAPRRG
jgi:hypothetical protein